MTNNSSQTIDGIIEHVETTEGKIQFSITKQGEGESEQRYSIPYNSQADYALRQKPFARVDIEMNGSPTHIKGMSLYDVGKIIPPIEEITARAPSRMISVSNEGTSVTYLGALRIG